MNAREDDLTARLRAADPVPVAVPPSDGEVEDVVAYVQNPPHRVRSPQRRVVTRRLLLGGIAASAVGLAAANELWSQEPAAAVPLQALAHDVATAPPPDADVLYVQVRRTEIASHDVDPERTAIRLRNVYSSEEWHPLWSQPYKPYQLENLESEYLTSRDAERAARLSPEQRRLWLLPPEGIPPNQTRPTPGCARVDCSWAYPDVDASDDPATFANPTADFVRNLPTDPAALKRLIETDPTLDRFHNYHWGVRDTWDRLANWDELRDERYSVILLGLLKFVPTPQPVRAALIRLLADVRSIVVYGNRRVGNRTGVAVGHTSDPPSDATVIDRETGLVIGERVTALRHPDLPADAVLSETSLLRLDYVPAVGDRP